MHAIFRAPLKRVMLTPWANSLEAPLQDLSPEPAAQLLEHPHRQQSFIPLRVTFGLGKPKQLSQEKTLKTLSGEKN